MAAFQGLPPTHWPRALPPTRATGWEGPPTDFSSTPSAATLGDVFWGVLFSFPVPFSSVRRGVLFVRVARTHS